MRANFHLHAGDAMVPRNTLYSNTDADRESVLGAVRSGQFYCSNGLELERFEFDGSTITVEAGSKDWEGSPNRYLFSGEDGAILSVVEGKVAEYRLRGDERYVRVRAHSEAGASLWTQPVYDRGFFSNGDSNAI